MTFPRRCKNCSLVVKCPYLVQNGRFRMIVVALALVGKPLNIDTILPVRNYVMSEREEYWSLHRHEY